MSQGLEFEVRNRLSSAQVEDLLRLYGNEWWSAQRTRPDVERMLEASDLLFAIIEKESGSLAAFARVLTDRTYLALVLDVIVAPEHRGGGLGRLLVERICSEPTLQNVASIELVCQPELVPLYEKWGFSENVGRSRLMRRTSDPLLADADEPPTRVVDCSATAPRWSAQHYVCDEGEELRGGLMSKKTHHVVPNQSGGWSVRKGGASRASKVFDRQSEAIDYAKDLAKKNSSELYVHRTDGTIREKSSYGNDPNPPKDKK